VSERASDHQTHYILNFIALLHQFILSSACQLNMGDIHYVDYENERHLSDIQKLVSRDLSEPYSIFTYRYFLHNWPELCICAFAKNEVDEMEMIGTIVSKAEMENGEMKGYIAMLTVNQSYRKRGIGRKLAVMGLERMVKAGCSEIVLETELSNSGAIYLYEQLGFIKEDRLAR
jgi:peptide alpha-N-acetyltransferase